MLNDKRYYKRLFGKWFCECSCGEYHKFIFKRDDSFEWEIYPNSMKARLLTSLTSRCVGTWYIESVSRELRDFFGFTGQGIAQQILVMNTRSNERGFLGSVFNAFMPGDSQKKIILFNVDGPDGNKNFDDGNIFDVDGNVRIAFDRKRQHGGILRMTEYIDESGVVHVTNNNNSINIGGSVGGGAAVGPGASVQAGDISVGSNVDERRDRHGE
jgi:hypothetical protein